MTKLANATKLIKDAYATYEEHREEFHAFCADSKTSRIIRDYELLKDQVLRSADHVKNVYKANYKAIGDSYKDFSMGYATELDGAKLVELLGDDADLYIEYRPVVDRAAYDVGVRNGNIPASVAKQVESRQPRCKAPKF